MIEDLLLCDDGTISHAMDRAHAFLRGLGHDLPHAGRGSLHLLRELGISNSEPGNGCGDVQ